MFLNIDKFVEDGRVAAIDDSGNNITYKQLVDNASDFNGVVPARSIVFQLCENTVGSLNAYVSMVENNVIPVTLSHTIDDELFQTLYDIYKPQYICINKDDAVKYDLSVVYESNSFVWLDCANPQYPVHDKVQLLMTTSGSTGCPKLVKYKKGNLDSNAKNVAIAFGWTEDERSICDLAMNYTMGLNIINAHLYVGAQCLLISSNIMSKKYWEFIKENKGTNFCGVPFSYDLYWKLHFKQMDTPYLKTMCEGGGKLTDAMFKDVAEFCKKSGKRFIPSFGTTETSARMARLEPEYTLDKIGSIGKAIPEGELFLLDVEGNVIDDVVAEGELAYRGPNVTMGYALNAADLAKDDEFKGVYKTGDVARRDSDGFYYIVGRMSRFLKLLSYRVSLDQCERMIQEEFGCEVACSGTDQKMSIYIVSDSDITKDVQRFISSKLNMYPSLFGARMIDKLPRNTSGKIMYKELD